MPVLHVHLRDGFADDAVVVRVNGRGVLEEGHVSTRQQIGLAARAEAEVPAGATATVEVALPKRGLTETVRVDVGEEREVYVGVSVTDGRIGHRVSREPMGYV